MYFAFWYSLSFVIKNFAFCEKVAGALQPQKDGLLQNCVGSFVLFRAATLPQIDHISRLLAVKEYSQRQSMMHNYTEATEDIV